MIRKEGNENIVLLVGIDAEKARNDGGEETMLLLKKVKEIWEIWILNSEKIVNKQATRKGKEIVIEEMLRPSRIERRSVGV